MLHYLKRLYPTYNEKNVAIYYLLSFLTGSWFQIGSWIFFVLMFVTEAEFAVYEAIAFAIAALIEIPSGAIADLIGRKKTVVISFYLLSIGCLMFTLAPLSKWLMLIGNIIIIVSFSLKSGSLEALLYDSLKAKNKVDHFDDVVGKSESIRLVMYVLAGLIGGIAWKIHPYLPWILTTLFFCIATVFSHKLEELGFKPQKFTIKDLTSQTKEGFKYLFTPLMMPLTTSLMIILGSYYMWHTGIIRVLMGRDFGLDGSTISYVISAAFLVSFIFNYYFEKIRETIGDQKGFVLFSLVLALSWIVSWAIQNPLVGIIVFLVITVSGSITSTWNSIIINKVAKTKDRATVISTLSFFVQLPYIFIVIYYGKLAESGGTANFYLLTGLMIILAIVVFYHQFKVIKEKVKTP